VPKSKPNQDFADVLRAASDQIWLDWNKAGKFKHSGSRGTVREGAVARFLSSRLPSAFDIAQGEALDRFGNRTPQFDGMIYDAVRNCALIKGQPAAAAASEPSLMPAEALLCVFEVKSVLTLDELKACYVSAGKLRALRPFGKRFVGPRVKGQSADDNNFRCLYTVFAYSSNLGATDWLSKEWNRAQQACDAEGFTPGVIERILVLDRGLIDPAHGIGKISAREGADTFFDWYLHLSNFILRENARRPTVDWQYYGGETSPGWTRLA
jgi:hypothetical protein